MGHDKCLTICQFKTMAEMAWWLVIKTMISLFNSIFNRFKMTKTASLLCQHLIIYQPCNLFYTQIKYVDYFEDLLEHKNRMTNLRSIISIKVRFGWSTIHSFHDVNKKCNKYNLCLKLTKIERLYGSLNLWFYKSNPLLWWLWKMKESSFYLV